MKHGRCRFGAGLLAALATLALASVCAAATALADGWSAQTAPTTEILNAVKFVDSETGWAVGGGGVILKTVNGGTDWSQQTSPTTNDLTAVWVYDATTAWAAGSTGTILKTTDGSAWTKVTTPTTNDLQSLTFVGSSEGWAVGWGSTGQPTILHTTNGGTSWAAQTITGYGVGEGLNCVSMRDADHGLAVGSVPGKVARYTSGAWSVVSFSGAPSDVLYGVKDVDATHAYLVGNAGVVAASADDGATWTVKQSGLTYNLRSVDFINANMGFATGTNTGSGAPKTLRTTDGAGSWTSDTNPLTDTLNGIDFVNSYTGWAVGNSGAIIKYAGTAPTPPVSTSTYSFAANASAGWKTTDQTVELSASGGTGSITLHYSTNGGSTWSTATGTSASVAITDEGAHHFKYYATDALEATEATHDAGYVNIDKTVPTVIASGTDTSWHKTPVTVTLTPSDAGSGVSKTQYRLEGGPTWLDTASDQFTVPASGEGERVYEYRALDVAGNASGTGTATVKIDASAPTTAATGLQTSGNSWGNTATTVTFSAEDAGSGSPTILYTVDGGAQQTYTAPLSYSSDCRHTIVYWAVDALGNEEAHNTGYVNVDRSAPSISVPADTDWHTGAFNVMATVGDTGGSGVAGVQYQVKDSGNWPAASKVDEATYACGLTSSADGTVTFVARVTDNAGNTDSVEFTRKFDVTAPTCTPAGLQANATTGWQAAAQDVRLDAGDAAGGSGVKEIHYVLDGGAEQTASGATTTFNVSGHGSHTVSYWAVDNAGNATEHATGYVNIVTEAPVTTPTNVVADATSGWVKSGVEVTFAVAAQTGLNVTVHYELDGGAEQTIAAGGSITVSGDGSHSIVYWAVDEFGNTENERTAFVNIESTAPVTTATGLSDSAGAAWQKSATVALTATDATAGVGSVFYTIDGGAETVYSAPFNVADGEHAIAYWAVDKAGNAEAKKTGYVKVDSKAPTAKAKAVTLKAAKAKKGKKAKIKVTISDPAPSCGTADLTISIASKKGKVIFTTRLSAQATNKALTVPFKLKKTLKKGKYRILCTATDAAGNVQAAVAKATLKVK